jgi:hypothetical protein
VLRRTAAICISFMQSRASSTSRDSGIRHGLACRGTIFDDGPTTPIDEAEPNSPERETRHEGMMTMVAMSCEQRLHASTAGLEPGSTHKLIALLADNVHAPVMPEVADSVEVAVR